MSKLRLPQARILLALRSGACLTRNKLAEAAGFSVISATVWRALNGVREGSSTGDPRPGLLELGYVSKEDLDIDGVAETNYSITESGIEAIDEWLQHNEVPEVRSRELSVNKRYSGGGNESSLFDGGSDGQNTDAE